MKYKTNSKSSSIAVNPILQRVFLVAIFGAFLVQAIQIIVALVGAEGGVNTYISPFLSIIGIPVALFVLAYLAVPKNQGAEATIFSATLLSVVGIALLLLVGQLLVSVYKFMPGTEHGLRFTYFDWTLYGVTFGLYAAILYCLKRCKSL
jgi:hypothetical protein